MQNETGANDGLDLKVQPIPAASRKNLDGSPPHILSHPDWFIWCSSVLKEPDGSYHMFSVRWPKWIGFYAWLTHSEVVHAVAEKPEGPYSDVGVAIPPVGEGRGDWFTAHNAKIKFFDGRYYLYFIQTRGDSFADDPEGLRLEMAQTGGSHELWKAEARPNQRTFVAVADSIDGPWKVHPDPIVQPAKTITTITVNPAVCRGPNGTYFMIVKGDKPNATGFIRNQALATAGSPVGPWTIHDEPVIDYIDTEDVSMWYDQTRNRFYAVFHVPATHAPPVGFIGMITSSDGIHWEKASRYCLLEKRIPLDDGTLWTPGRMERPFVLTNDRGQPEMLYVACKEGNSTCVVALALDAGAS